MYNNGEWNFYIFFVATPQHCTSFSHSLHFSINLFITDRHHWYGWSENKRKKHLSTHSSTLIKKLFVSLTNVMCHRISTQSSTHYWVSMSRYLVRRVRSEKKNKSIENFCCCCSNAISPSCPPLLNFFSFLTCWLSFGNVRESLKIELWNKNPIKRFFCCCSRIELKEH